MTNAGIRLDDQTIYFSILLYCSMLYVPKERKCIMFDHLHDPQSYALQDSQAYIRWLYVLLVARSDHTTGSRNMKPPVVFKVQKMARSICLIFPHSACFFARLWPIRVRVRVSFTTGSTVGHPSHSWASCYHCVLSPSLSLLQGCTFPLQSLLLASAHSLECW